MATRKKKIRKGAASAARRAADDATYRRKLKRGAGLAAVRAAHDTRKASQPKATPIRGKKRDALIAYAKEIAGPERFARNEAHARRVDAAKRKRRKGK